MRGPVQRACRRGLGGGTPTGQREDGQQARTQLARAPRSPAAGRRHGVSLAPLTQGARPARCGARRRHAPQFHRHFTLARRVDVHAGMAELCRLNPAFGALREALFSRAAASFSRDQQQPEALQQLDAAVHEFCSLLTQHFLSAGAFKALEYLIRRFK